jgi:hypothetical protein
MERDKEIAKLVNVLRRIARAAGHAMSSRDADAAQFCVLQYNKVLARLSGLEPSVATLFTALPVNASPDVTRVAAHELAAYFDDEVSSVAWGGPVRGHGCGGRRAWIGRVKLSCS